MGTLRDDLAADLGAALGDYGQTFEWKGDVIPCVRTTAPAPIEALPGGQQIAASDRITVAYPDLPAGRWPREGDLVDRNRFQVVQVDPNLGHVVLWCAPPMNFAAGLEG